MRSSSRSTPVARVPTSSGSSVNLGSNLAAGDQLAFTKESGGVLKAWAKQGAGAWTAITTVTDTTYFNAGQTYNIGWGAFGSTYRLDDFGGGTIISGASQPAARPRSSIVPVLRASVY
jgi:hypothetical protein